jgi:hypothetical protein
MFSLPRKVNGLEIKKLFFRNDNQPFPFRAQGKKRMIIILRVILVLYLMFSESITNRVDYKLKTNESEIS